MKRLSKEEAGAVLDDIRDSDVVWDSKTVGQIRTEMFEGFAREALGETVNIRPIAEGSDEASTE